MWTCCKRLLAPIEAVDLATPYQSLKTEFAPTDGCTYCHGTAVPTDHETCALLGANEAEEPHTISYLAQQRSEVLLESHSH